MKKDGKKVKGARPREAAEGAAAEDEDLSIVIKKAKSAAGAAVATSRDKASDNKDKKNKKDKKDKKDAQKKKARDDSSSDEGDEAGGSGAKQQRQSPRLKPMAAPEAPKWGEKTDKKRKRAEDENHEASEASGNVPLTDFDIGKETQAKLKEAGITSLFPIQAATFKHVMAGKDLIARARTGTGKTLSFVLPVHERLVAMRKEGLIDPANKRGRAPVCLVLSPTRELTKQIGTVFETVAAGSLSVLTVYGGVPYDKQGEGLRAGVDVVVGTPGRVTDFMERGQLKMDKIRFFVLDEADEMLNIGFKEHVDKIFAQVVGDMGEGAGVDDERQAEVQTLLFSATVPAWIKEVTTKYFKKETTVHVDLVSGGAKNETALKIQHLCLPCPWSSRAQTIGDIVLCYAGAHGRTIIFTETKKEANELALDDAVKQECAVLHGDIAQAQRETTFQAFRDGKFRCLVATDVAARGEWSSNGLERFHH
jgi:ATP-dependent RNA helicase DDX21